jgi:hypothetical protein
MNSRDDDSLLRIRNHSAPARPRFVTSTPRVAAGELVVVPDCQSAMVCRVDCRSYRSGMPDYRAEDDVIPIGILVSRNFLRSREKVHFRSHRESR